MIKKLFFITFILLSVYIFPANAKTPPILSNFRIETSNSNRVYFDSSESITGSSTQGFIISGKTINGISINSGATSGHFFTVSSPFTFWDNNTIRYSSGSNIHNASTTNLYPFDLQYIENNLKEPKASTNRYVSLSGAGLHGG